MEGMGSAVVKILFDFAKGVGTSVAPKIMAIVSDLLKKKLENLSVKLSKPAQEAVKRAGESGQNEIPVEVLDELRMCVGEVLKEQSSPVYADCVIFFTDKAMDEERQELMRNVITGDVDPWEDETDQKKQEFVDKFMEAYIGGSVQMEEDCDVGDKYISLNFLEYENHVYCEEDMRDLADALNYFLGDRYITSFHLV